MTTLHVEAAVAGRKRAGAPDHDIEVGLSEGEHSLRSLIEAVVRAEVAAFRARAEDDRFVQVLTAESLAEGLAAGAVRHGDREVAADVDPDDAVATALQAHDDGVFQVFVEDEPIDDLDTVLALRDGVSVMFLRLVALAGG